MAWSQGLARMAVYKAYASTTMKSTSTISFPVCTNCLIIPLGMKVFPSKLIKGISQGLRSQGFKPSPLYKLWYIISPLINHTPFYFVSSYSKGDHKSVIIQLDGTHLSTSVKPKIRSSSILLLLAFLASSPTASYGEMVITSIDGATVPHGVEKIMLMVPKGGRMAESLQRTDLDFSIRLDGWCISCFNFPALTNQSKKSWSIL